MKRLVIFDLDGTLLNTIGDLAEATNYALEQCGYPQHAVEEYNMFVGNGIAKLFGIGLCPRMHVRQSILPACVHFSYRITTATMYVARGLMRYARTLAELQRRGALLAVASINTSKRTEKLVAAFFPEDKIYFRTRSAGRDTGKARSYNRIRYFGEGAGRSRRGVVLVGDSGVDMQTAAAARVLSVGVAWGFRSREELECEEPVIWSIRRMRYWIFTNEDKYCQKKAAPGFSRKGGRITKIYRIVR